MNLKTKLFKLYIAFIRPSLDYASIFWMAALLMILKKLEKVQ